MRDMSIEGQIFTVFVCLLLLGAFLLAGFTCVSNGHTGYYYMKAVDGGHAVYEDIRRDQDICCFRGTAEEAYNVMQFLNGKVTTKQQNIMEEADVF